MISNQLATVGALLGPTHTGYQDVPRSAKIKTFAQNSSILRSKEAGFCDTSEQPGLLTSMAHGSELQSGSSLVKENKRDKSRP